MAELQTINCDLAKNSRFICLKTMVKINNLVKPCGSYSEEYYKLKVCKIWSRLVK